MPGGNAPTDWWETFFSGLAVEFWDAVMPESATAEDAAFLWKHLALARGSRVLDVPCGSGRLTRPLAAGGCRMTGVDISAEAIALAAGRAIGAGTIDYRRAEMRDLPWEAAFDAAFCFGNSFGFLDDAGNEAFLASVARCLRPRGLFALDYGQTAEAVLSRIAPHEEADVAGFRFVEDTRYDPGTARIENVFTFAQGGRTETKLASQRVYRLAELLGLLAGQGFEVLRSYGSPREEPFGPASPRLLVIAEKAG